MASSTTGFFQSPPRFGNQYQEDNALRSLLGRILPPALLEQIEKDVSVFGELVTKEVWEWGIECETNTPTIQHFDAWGQRIDKIITADGWKKIEAVAAREGTVAIGYERKFGQWSRLYQFIKLYLMSPSTIFLCPLAMTDGASRVLELYGDAHLKETVLKRLTSRDPATFATSGQWMTERTGGSDVSNSETIAVKDPNGGERDYLLTGYKFFTSSTTSQFALALARIQNTSRLSVFCVKVRNDDGSLNNITVARLKNKLGTKGVPTAELELKGTKAKLLGDPEKGVSIISSQFNITRVYNATSAAAVMRRGIAVARDYAFRRKAFGKQLSDQPLHVRTLSNMEVIFRGTLHFVFRTVHLLGMSEVASEDTANAEKLLRLLTPLVKLFTAKEAVGVVSEAIECLGGTGYMEDSHMAGLLREVQVLPIWEGTTNVLSLDVLRIMHRTPDSFAAFFADLKKRLSGPSKAAGSKVLPYLADTTLRVANKTLEYSKRFAAVASGEESLEDVEADAREFALSLASVYAASLLLEHAAWSGESVDAEIALRYCYHRRIVTPELVASISPASDQALFKPSRKMDKVIAMDCDPRTGEPRGVGDYDLTGKLRARY